MAIQKITSGIIADGAIVATDIADGTVTTAKIADGSITTAKLSSNAVPQIIKPTITSPSNNATDVSPTATISATAYFSLYGRTQANAEWQLSTSSDFAFINVENTITGSNTQLTLNNSVALANTLYYTRVRYSDDANNTSEYSDVVQFRIQNSIEATVLVVAGGGGGGGSIASYWAAGGGGGGGVAYATNQNITIGTPYTVTVGSGGSGGAAGPAPSQISPPGNNGTDSVFNNITAKGGGYGAGAQYNNATPTGALGGPGGSGGGAGPHWPGGSQPNALGGSATQPSQNPGVPNLTNYGSAGGNGEFSTNTGVAGGGGGAGGAGTNWNATPGTAAPTVLAGGAGVAFSISGSPITYSAGGPTNNSSFSGLVNTGAGGGGGNGPSPLVGGTGSSGVVILAYPNASANLTSISPALTYSYSESGGNRIYQFTAGTGNITG